MSKQVEEQQTKLQTAIEQKELNEFDVAFNELIKSESTAARNNPKNIFMMNQRR